MWYRSVWWVAQTDYCKIAEQRGAGDEVIENSDCVFSQNGTIDIQVWMATHQAVDPESRGEGAHTELDQLLLPSYGPTRTAQETRNRHLVPE